MMGTFLGACWGSAEAFCEGSILAGVRWFVWAWLVSAASRKVGEAAAKVWVTICCKFSVGWRQVGPAVARPPRNH